MKSKFIIVFKTENLLPKGKNKFILGGPSFRMQYVALDERKEYKQGRKERRKKRRVVDKYK